jgi:hypothetical protein
MIIHYVYHIPGRKVGCCKDIERRMGLYEEMEGQRPNHEILEALHGGSDQEAGDIEWAWADRLGYRRGVHYTVTMNMRRIGAPIGARRLNELLTPEQKIEFGRKSGLIGARRLNELLTPEQKIEFGRKGGFHRMETMTAEQRSEFARRATAALTPEQRSANARKAARRTAELGLGACYQRAECPHCGLEGNVVNMKRWHFDNCPHKDLVARISWAGGLGRVA